MTKTTYFWDEVTDNVIMESDDEGNVTTYTHEPKLHGKVLSQNRNGVPSYFHYDGQGNVRQVTDSAGNVTDEMTYTAFGETVSKTGSTVNPWGYKGALGYYTNPGTDDLYVRARTLEPSVGRWMSEDPIGFVDGPNLYLYVWNTPTIYQVLQNPQGPMPVDPIPPNPIPPDPILHPVPTNPKKPPKPPVNPELRICNNSIQASEHLGHLYLVLKCTFPSNNTHREIGYRGGPANGKHYKWCNHCKFDSKYGQLVSTHGHYVPGFIDYRTPNNENCEDVALGNLECLQIDRCLRRFSSYADYCCVPYCPTPGAHKLTNCANSNSWVYWALQVCIPNYQPKNYFLYPVTPGVSTPVPKCITDLENLPETVIDLGKDLVDYLLPWR